MRPKVPRGTRTPKALPIANSQHVPEGDNPVCGAASHWRCAFEVSGCLGMQPKIGGKLHLKPLKVKTMFSHSWWKYSLTNDRFYHWQWEDFGPMLSNVWMREWLKITLQIETEIRPLAVCWFIIIFISLVTYTCVHSWTQALCQIEPVMFLLRCVAKQKFICPKLHNCLINTCR